MGWNARMLFLGIANSAGYGIILAYLYLLSARWDRQLQYTQLIVFVQAVPIIGRFLNASYFITVQHYIRLFIVVLG